MPTYIYRGRSDTFTYAGKTVSPGERIVMPKRDAEHMARFGGKQQFEEVDSGDVLGPERVSTPTETTAPTAARPAPPKS